MNPKRMRHTSLGRAFTLALGLVFATLASSAYAEDPLLGRIKVIKCVGCNPGAVNLVVHDPIDVRDFEVQIKEGDYQKIISPLAGKTIYDKNGCFYWIDMPKVTKAASPDTTPKPEPVKPELAKVMDKKSKKKGSKTASTAVQDSIKAAETYAVAAAAPPTPKGKESKCIPFVRIEEKTAPRTGQKDED